MPRCTPEARDEPPRGAELRSAAPRHERGTWQRPRTRRPPAARPRHVAPTSRAPVPPAPDPRAHTTDCRARHTRRMRPRLQIIVSSTRPGRIGLPIAEWFASEATAHDTFEVDFADLAEIGLPLLDEPHHPRLGNYQHDHTKAWSERVAAADAFALVTPEYNHGFPAPLKNALDFLYREWNHKPVGFVSYGGVAAGTRAVALLKPVLL